MGGSQFSIVDYKPVRFRERIGGSQRQRRKDKRRAHAAGFKKAFN